MSDINFSTFPSNKVEAIAYLYVQKKEYVINPSPEELANDYMDAYKRASAFFNEHRDRSNWLV